MLAQQSYNATNTEQKLPDLQEAYLHSTGTYYYYDRASNKCREASGEAL